MSDQPPSSSSASHLEKQQQQHLITTTITTSSTSPPTPPIIISSTTDHHLHTQMTILQQQQTPPQVVVPPPFDYHPDFPSSVKRPRYTSTISSGATTTTTNQWKQLPSPTPTPTSAPVLLLPPKPQQQLLISAATPTTEASSPSSSTNPPPPLQLLLTQHPSVGASSSDTAASSPTQQRHQVLQQQQQQQSSQGGHGQMRKGKHVSPVWKPYEMLMLAKGWHLLYKTPSSSSSVPAPSRSANSDHSGRGTTINKSRAEKDRVVAEFLNRHGVERDAKAAGTKWDNMLGDFRKVYQWERGGGRIEAGVAKSYFRLSPYERKNQHGLPTSFDEEVFEEMAQFMGSRIKSNSTSTSLLQHIDDDEGGRGRGGGCLLAFKETDERTTTGNLISCNENELVPLKRIGKVKMVWEESVSLWGEEGSSESTTGRMKIGALPSSFSSFLNADELVLFDDSMVASPLEAYENGPLRGFSVDVFSPGQQVKVFGRRKAASTSSAPAAYCHACRSQLPVTQHSPRSYLVLDCQDPSEYYLSRLRVAPSMLPALSELSIYLQQPPSEEFKFPLRRDVYRDLPQGKGLFFTTLNELLDCRTITYDILGPILRSDIGASSTPSCRDSYIALWDDCINSVVRKFCSIEMAIVRKPVATALESSQSSNQILWPNVTGFIKGLCLWRGEETDQIREGDHQTDPSSLLVQNTLWTYADLPYIFGYYAVGHIVTLCALTRPDGGTLSDSNQVLRTDLISIDLSRQVDRLKALIPCWRIATLLPILAEKCSTTMETGQLLFSDFERVTLANNNNGGSSDVVIESSPTSEIRYFSNKRKWTSFKEIYDFLGRRIPHSEYIAGSCEARLCITLKPRGCKVKPRSVDQLIEALKSVSKCLVALHDISFMHRDISWEKVMRRVVTLATGEEDGGGEVEWFLSGFERAAGAPQMSAFGGGGGSHAPEMRRGLHGVKVDVWGIGLLIKTCGLVMLPMQLRDLQNRCLEHNQEMRPTAADCYHHLLQLSAAAAGGY